ncbi:MAG: HPr family phosphocarrier protein [Ignavibacteriaceae bacterium]|nr:HPr family phosphocarrier protein [Ignavibacteriaceae bacterium]
MVRQTVRIVNKAGLHTRPAAMLVKIASKFKSEFFIEKDGYSINGKSIIGVMSIGAPYDSEIILQFEGVDEEEMAEAIYTVIARGFEEL